MNIKAQQSLTSCCVVSLAHSSSSLSSERTLASSRLGSCGRLAQAFSLVGRPHLWPRLRLRRGPLPLLSSLWHYFQGSLLELQRLSVAWTRWSRSAGIDPANHAAAQWCPTKLVCHMSEVHSTYRKNSTQNRQEYTQRHGVEEQSITNTSFSASVMCGISRRHKIIFKSIKYLNQYFVSLLICLDNNNNNNDNNRWLEICLIWIRKFKKRKLTQNTELLWQCKCFCESSWVSTPSLPLTFNS